MGAKHIGEKKAMSLEKLTKGELTRSSIIQAAHGLIISQGYHGTSMRQIAHETGIALGGIYNHFASKEEIFVAVLEAYHPYRDLLPLLETTQEESVADFIHVAANSMVSSLKKRPDLLNLIFIESVEFNNRHFPKLFDVFYPKFDAMFQHFAEEQSSLRNIPTPMFVRAFVGMFFSLYMTEMMWGEHFPKEMKENTLEHFIDIYLHGILKKE